MFEKVVILVFCLRIFVGANYCSLACKHHHETFQNSACKCVHNPSRCNGFPKILPPTPSIQQRIVDIHNNYREKVASGQEKRGGNIGATDMMLLTYDTDLEHVAECHNKQCIADHDNCRLTDKFRESVGQNFYGWYGKKCDWSILRHSTRAWYEEVAESNTACIRNFSQCSLYDVGHYTQMVWAKTTHVGCSVLEFDGSRGISCHVFCNYGSAGNYEHQAVYTLGQGGKACERRDARYRHLCVQNTTNHKYGVPNNNTIGNGVGHKTKSRGTTVAFLGYMEYFICLLVFFF